MVMPSLRVRELDLDNFDGLLTQTVVLANISWPTLQAILTDMGDHRATRLAYNHGVLTFKMPSRLHEIINRLLARIVTTLTEELGLDVVNVGSTPLEREDLEKAAEPDTGFYIQNASRLTGLDPVIPDRLPPDLVIEVDITSPSIHRLDIYQTLGIPEVWRYTKQHGLSMYQLRSGQYVEVPNSATCPQVTASQLNAFLQQRRTQSENQVIQSVRQWIQSQT